MPALTHPTYRPAPFSVARRASAHRLVPATALTPQLAAERWQLGEEGAEFLEAEARAGRLAHYRTAADRVLFGEKELEADLVRLWYLLCLGEADRSQRVVAAVRRDEAARVPRRRNDGTAARSLSPVAPPSGPGRHEAAPVWVYSAHLPTSLSTDAWLQLDDLHERLARESWAALPEAERQPAIAEAVLSARVVAAMATDPKFQAASAARRREVGAAPR